MLLTREVRQGVEVLAVAGPVEGPDAAALQQAVDRALQTGPRGVVVDLSDAGPLAPAAVDVLNWTTARAAGWPRPSLALCCASDELADLLLPEVHMHPCRDDALAHVDDRPVDHVCVRTEVPCTPEGPAAARRAARECAAEQGFHADDLALVVSELVTNAVRHGQPPVELEIETCEQCVTVVVTDGGGALPQVREAAPVDEGGRGLHMVELLAAETGVRASPPGKAVWAELPREPVRAEREAPASA